MRSPLTFNHRAVVILLEHEVHDSSNCVRPILGRSSIAEHLKAIQSNGRYGRQIGALGSAGNTCAKQRDNRSTVTALAVHQNQGGVGGQRSQGRRTDERCGIADRLLRDVVRRHQCGYQIVHVGMAMRQKVIPADHVDWYRRIRCRAVAAS